MPGKSKKIMLNKNDVENYIQVAKDFYFNDKDNVDELVALNHQFPEYHVGGFIEDLVRMKKPKTTIFKVLNAIGYGVC